MRYKILPIFLPHLGCPHKCVFCDQKTITGDNSKISIKKICEEIETFCLVPDSASSSKVRKEIAFYGSSFTAIPERLQRELLDPAFHMLEKKRIDGIRISTRPDYCTSNIIDLLKEYRVETVEVGVQSMDHEVLRRSGRGHGPEECIQALNTLKNKGFVTGVQLMPGLPGEDRKSFLTTIYNVISLRPEFVRLYPALVIKGTPLEELFQKGLYNPLSLTDAISLCKDGIKLLRGSGIKIIRCGLQPTPSLQREGAICAGPFHPAFGELVESEIIFDHINGCIHENIESSNIKESIVIQSSPGQFSILKGQGGKNLERLRGLYPDLRISMKQDTLLPEYLIRVKNESGSFWDVKNQK
ncbi:MAG: elongator complex protein 3 [bacterium]